MVHVTLEDLQGTKGDLPTFCRVTLTVLARPTCAKGSACLSMTFAKGATLGRVLSGLGTPAHERINRGSSCQAWDPSTSVHQVALCMIKPARTKAEYCLLGGLAQASTQLVETC